MTPVPVLGWDAPEEAWLSARASGLGASDVAAALGFSRWESPWQVWAEKTGRARWDQTSAATELGKDLEPWLLAQAPKLLNMEVDRTPHRLYAVEGAPWQMCSPDAFAADQALVEAKTARLFSTWSSLDDWADDGLPLGYEFQARWQMHVMGRDRVHVIALVAGLGLIARTVDRNQVTEASMVQQMTEWWTTHIQQDVEPPISSQDLAALGHVYNLPAEGQLAELGQEALSWQREYRAALEAETAAKARKEEYGALIKAALGNATVGMVHGTKVATWNGKRGEVDWGRMARDLASQNGVDIPDPDSYRKPSGRTLSVKKHS